MPHQRQKHFVLVCFIMPYLLHVAVFSQPIISKSKPQLLKTHFLPLMEKLKKVSTFIFYTLQLIHLLLLYPLT